MERREKIRARASAGIVLMDALLASVILLASIFAITWPFTVSARNEVADARQAFATALAQEMMDEVIRLPFSDANQPTVFGPHQGRARTTFTNVADANGLTESTGNICSLDGEVENDPLVRNFSRQVTVTPVWVTGQNTSLAATFLSVQVTVNYQGQPMTTLTRLVYNHQ